MKSPAFQFYPADWLGSQRVQMLTLEEEGAYIRLLSFCWQHGSIPADVDQAARLIGKGGSTTLQPPLVGSLPNGTNQTSTLLSSSTSTSSSTESNHKQGLPAAPKAFVPPTPEEVTAYSIEIGYPLDGHGWCDVYIQKGWAIKGSTKMKDWKAAVRNWKTSGYKIGPFETLFSSRDLQAQVRHEQRISNPSARI